MTAVQEACRNCGAERLGRYCAECGQQVRPPDPTARELLIELVHELASVDGRIARSVRHLFLAPGFLTREYLNGRRAAWVSPLRLYLTFSVLYFAVVSFTGTAPFDFSVGVQADTDQETRETLRSLGFSSEAELSGVVNRALGTWVPRAMFVLVPLFAWFVSRVRRRSGRHYPQHLIFTLHVFAVFFGVLAVTTALGTALDRPVAAVSIGIAGLAYAALSMARAMQVVYGGRLITAAVHTVLVLAASWVATIALTAIIVLPLLYRR